VSPYFYQTAWFRTLTALLIAGSLAWLLYFLKAKNRRKLLEQKMITKAEITGQEKERQLIGTELHDNINQQLATAKLYLDLAKTDENMRLPMVQKSEVVVQNVIDEIRALCKSIIPPTLKDIGLEEALKDLLASYTSAGKFATHFSNTAPLHQLKEDLRFTFFRITQEQLNNISRHARAKSVWVELAFEKNTICLTIKDDGRGFDTTKKAAGLGLNNIKNRLGLYNGEMELQSLPGKGCTMKCRVNLQKSNKEEMLVTKGRKGAMAVEE
jgi:two-component system sensor histidine kinase UhpB